MIVELKNVSWQRDERVIVRDVNWQVKQGEHWCLVGLNGSGKTTLLNLITGHIWPTKGEVSVLGHKFGEVDLRELRKQIGWVSSALQVNLHGQDRAQEIVVSGKFATIGLYTEPTGEDRARALELLEFFRCSHLVGRTYATLSQGEKQKVLIARALMASPKLLILDEPCTGLDLLAREQLLEVISQIAEQPEAPTLLYVTHHIEEILPCFSHTLLIKDGSVYQAAQTKSLLTSETLSGFFGVPIHTQEENERIWISIGT
ncbi:ABC transporter ATP-binding protein [Brevibacillus fulvus]|uniref:Iron complex transport system ATP-binding protein n=1 Tax=Brevibacillus fulvus TaxID=1125967 RepID=A0A938XVH5_9BACL|nr:ABC transporter ATP-binding protein [Brevibacillus fulvus]MBM7588463.1 iron complex transport system ATP-binding protein [Brevibacillus fulvus]